MKGAGMNRMTRILTVMLVALAAGLCGCKSDPAKVSEGDLTKVRASFDQLAVGMTKDEALGTFKKGSKVRLSSSVVAGANVEEYKIEAYHDDDWNKRRDLFVAFLYFLDGTLVEISDTRENYAEEPATVERWRTIGGGGDG
jgi:hypothetical protein